MSGKIESLLEEILERMTTLETRVRENGRMIQRLEEAVCDRKTPDERRRQEKERENFAQTKVEKSESASQQAVKVAPSVSEKKEEVVFAMKNTGQEAKPATKVAETPSEKKKEEEPVFFNDEDSDLQFDD